MPRHAIDIRCCKPWPRILPGAAACARRAARAALDSELDGESAGLSLVLSDDAELEALNRAWRGQDKPTDVLAFPCAARDPATGRRQLGDVIVSGETAHADAASLSRPLAEHLSHLVVHGILHLLGYDHEAPKEARRMEARERALLASLGIADPYRRSPRAKGQ